MKWLILLISTLAVAYSRPQTTHNEDDSSVEFEKQDVIEIHPDSRELYKTDSQRQIEENTRDILEKIAEVNKKQGLSPKKAKPNYFHFPYGYSRSQEDANGERDGNSFQFPKDPFTNPIFQYMNNKNDDQDGSNLRATAIVNPNPQLGYQITNINSNADIKPEDIVPGQYIKRKVVHQQTVVVPNPNPMMNMYNQMYPPMPAMSPYTMIPQVEPNMHLYKAQLGQKDESKTTINSLEKQTIDNIKNIVTNSQSQMMPMYYNPYLLYPQQENLPYTGPQTVQNHQGMIQESPEVPQGANGDINKLYNPYIMAYAAQSSRPQRQFNWNWPGAQYFPIVIRDPFAQMFNALTTMIEYGPPGGGGGGCKGKQNTKPKNPQAEQNRTSKTSDELGKLSYKVTNEENNPEIIIFGTHETSSDIPVNSTYLDLEDIHINGKDPLKFTMNVKPSREREAKDNNSNQATKANHWDTNYKISSTEPKPLNRQDLTSKIKRFPSLQDLIISTSTSQSTIAVQRQSPPIRDQILHEDELVDEESDKAEDVSISHDGNKKLFSKDNTGSGIFIHKLKVRKGGVAIAGPGGIATAGSGGTAIVGPNGYAYTHPDSLAIAGSGTKVIAVEPNISLSDIIHNVTAPVPPGSGQKPTNSVNPPSRVGKVVAVGPVVYYNKG